MKMDVATLIGLLGAFGIVIGAMASGGSVGVFLNAPSMMIVMGGTLMVVLMKFNLGQFLGAFSVASNAFSSKLSVPESIITQVIEMATVARKEGVLALEKFEFEDKFLGDGIRLVIDGSNSEEVEQLLTKDMQQIIDRHKWGAQVFSAAGDVAPAMGMIGTLVGLVQMLSAMDDPKSIGPAMAVALLTTLYGAMLANMVFLPLSDKLNLRKAEESRLNAICIDGIIAIQSGQHPRVLESNLKLYLNPKKRNAGSDPKSEAT
jgi:chemotaxis protein MotA